MSRPPSQTVAAEDVVVAVQTYADRLHDLLRRRGLGVADATAVVTRSAHDLVDAAASADAPRDPLGWWWARALSLGDRTRSTAEPRRRDDDPVDAALAQLSAPLQLAVLLRDDYDLPLTSAAAALGVSQSLTADRVLQGRLQLVAQHDATAPLDTAGHDAREAIDTIGLLGVADGVASPADAARVRRHLRGCSTCEAIVTTAQRGRRLAAALPVEALPDEPREALIREIGERAHAALPALSDLLSAQEDQAAEVSSRPLVPLPVVLVSLACALVLGALTGAATAPSDPRSPSAGPDASLTPESSASPSAGGSATPSATATATPTTRRTTAPPSTPTALATTRPPVVAGPPAIAIDPSSGPNNQPVTVTGTGWQPGTAVTVDYVNLLGQVTSSTVADVRSDGRFSVTLVCSDPVPGQHTIRASDGASTATQRYQEQ